MLTGKRFKLITPTMAIYYVHGHHEGVTVPAGEIIKVVSDPSDGGRIVGRPCVRHVRW